MDCFEDGYVLSRQGWISENFRRDRTKALLVMVYLVLSINKENLVSLNREEIQEEFGFSRSTYYAIMKKLRNKDLIRFCDPHTCMVCPHIALYNDEKDEPRLAKKYFELPYKGS